MPCRFRRLVVRSGGAARRPEVPPRPARFQAAESGGAGVSPSPRRDASWICGSSQHRERGFGVVSSHGTRLHGRETRTEWTQSPARHMLAAMVIEA
jgi:hypothetical protein